MNNNSRKKTIKEAVLAKIKSGDIKRLSMSYFIFKSTLYILGVVILSTFLCLLVSFIFFTIKISGLWNLPQFGIKGIELLFSNLPWLLILVTLLSIFVLEVIAKRFGFVYRKPLLYSAFFIIFIVIIGSLIVRQVSFHEKIYSEIESGGQTAIKHLYDEYANPNPELFHPGTVLEITTRGFTLEDRDRKIFNIKITNNTKMRPNFDLHKGGRILVIGKVSNGFIEALIIDNAPLSGKP